MRWFSAGLQIRCAREASTHATSSDGITWIKDSDNPIMLQPDDTRWGYPGLGEPGAFHDEQTGTFHVYGVGGKVIGGALRAAIILRDSSCTIHDSCR